MKSRGQIVVSMDPSVAAHEAAARLGGEKAGSIKTDFCLSELSSMGEPDTKEFRVPNSDAFPKAHVEGLLELPLYTRQAKALSRMVSIENGEVPFTEEERSENILPGIGWCLIGRATRKSPLRGGVLGDAIGSEFISLFCLFDLKQSHDSHCCIIFRWKNSHHDRADNARCGKSTCKPRSHPRKIRSHVGRCSPRTFKAMGRRTKGMSFYHTGGYQGVPSHILFFS